MRVALAGAVLLVVGLGALIVGGPARPSDGTVTAAVEPASPADRYGTPLGGGAAAPHTAPPAEPKSAPQPGAASAETTTDEPAPTTAGGAEPTTTSTRIVVDAPAVGEGTTLVDDETEVVHQGGAHSEEEPDDEFPKLGEDEFPVSSNLPDGTGYPLAGMVQLAVDVLGAETTGQDRDRYPHLAGQVSVCCVDVVVDGAVVLFGATQADPATVIVEWHALDAVDRAHMVRGTTRTLWWWIDSEWLGEFELPESGTA